MTNQPICREALPHLPALPSGVTISTPPPFPEETRPDRDYNISYPDFAVVKQIEYSVTLTSKPKDSCDSRTSSRD